MLWQPEIPEDVRHCQIEQDHGLDQRWTTRLLGFCQLALACGEAVKATVPIRNVNRVVGTMLGSEVTRRYGVAGLPDATIHLHFQGSAGQSFGAFIPPGITLELEGDGNDYFGKGLSGGKVIVYPSTEATFRAEENVIIGNVALYESLLARRIFGAWPANVLARNSGADAVVEGVAIMAVNI